MTPGEARCLGAGRHEDGEGAVSVAFFTGFILGTCLGVFCLFHIDQVVMLLGATETIKPFAVEYARYIFLATPFMMCSFIMNNLLRLQGLAAFAMVGITTGGILNIALDPIFIFGLAPGPPLPPACPSLSVSAFFSPSATCAGSVSISASAISVHPFSFFGKILSGGLPSLTRQGMASIATIVLNTTAHPFGDAAIAAMAIVNRLIFFVNSSGAAHRHTSPGPFRHPAGPAHCRHRHPGSHASHNPGHIQGI